MRLSNLRLSKRKGKKRLGRGNASGRGTYSTRGIKGQKARAGARIRPGFEGGQTPLYKRLPKFRGKSPQRDVRATAVNLRVLDATFASGAKVSRETLLKAGLIPSRVKHVKILGDGEVTKPLTILLPTSASAKAKIEKAGGTVRVEEVRETGRRAVR